MGSPGARVPPPPPKAYGTLDSVPLYPPWYLYVHTNVICLAISYTRAWRSASLRLLDDYVSDHKYGHLKVFDSHSHISGP